MKTSKVLLCGIPSEAPIAKVKNALINKGAEVVIFNQRQIEDIQINWKFKNQKPTGELHIANCSYNLNSFDSVYSRFMSETNIPEVKDKNQNFQEHSRNVHESLYQWLEVTDSKVVNRHSKMFSNSSKPYQAQIIKRYGLKTPNTLITNTPTEAIAFHQKHGAIIYKSISGVRSIVKEFDPLDTERLEKIRFCPVQFQKKLSGFDVRVHVIDKEVVATKINTTGVDYRYARKDGGTTELETFAIPETIKNACINVSAALQLDFSGIDLRFTDEGDVYCFEVNPMPGYSYYESHTGQKISHVLADYLMN
ncbi:RimK-like ATP-grasp domain-containing protein [Tenacibaculum sp. 190524A02b]|uniref:RimK-like ATP-grasp domain-containing protein n=1 Tax=Tenacibaculum vairaonense TaxID=3137860 RepID=A0ABP1F9H8_9FLAO